MRRSRVIAFCVIAISLLVMALAIWWFAPSKVARQPEGLHVGHRAADLSGEPENHEPGEPAPESKKIVRCQPLRPHAMDRRSTVTSARPLRNVPQACTTTPPQRIGRTSYERVYAFLQSGPSDSGMPAHARHTIKNNLMNELCRTSPNPPDLTDVLIGIYRDRKQDDVIRDYALQHLSTDWYERVSPSEKSRIEDALWGALSEKQSSIAGTALLALTRIHADDKAANKARLRTAALQSLNDRTCSVLTRITAAQVCARLGVEEAMPIACRLAKSSPSFALRWAAHRAVEALSKEQGTPTVGGLNDCTCDQVVFRKLTRTVR